MKPAVPPVKCAVLLMALVFSGCGGGGGDTDVEAAASAPTSSGSAATDRAAATPTSEAVAARTPAVEEVPLRPVGPTMPYPGPNATPEEIRAWNAQCQTARCMIPER